MFIIRRIFGPKRIPSPEHAQTAPLDEHEFISELSLESRRHVRVGASHSVGIERSQDDDSSLILTGGSNGDKGLPDFGLFCVADGLGGYEHGRLASAIAIRTVARVLMEGAFLRLLEVEPIDEAPPLDELITNAFDAANQAVFELAEGGATTLTVALMLDEIIGHMEEPIEIPKLPPIPLDPDFDIIGQGHRLHRTGLTHDLDNHLPRINPDVEEKIGPLFT